MDSNSVVAYINAYNILFQNFFIGQVCTNGFGKNSGFDRFKDVVVLKYSYNTHIQIDIIKITKKELKNNGKLQQ